MADVRVEVGRLLRFGLVGVVNTGVDFLIFLAALGWLGAAPAVANLVAWALAATGGYFLHARFTFRPNGKPAPVSLSGFALVLAGGAGGAAASTLAIVLLSASLGPVGAKLCGVALAVAINYFATRTVLMKRPAAKV